MSFDGNIARWRHKPPCWGGELDSLADVILLRRCTGGIAYGVGMDGLWIA